MLKLFATLLIFSLVLIRENDALRGRDSFENKVRTCERLCVIPRFPPVGLPSRPNLPIPLPTLAPLPPVGPSRNDNKKCLVLLDHNNATVTLCLADCLERKGELLGNTVDCECRNRKCIPSNDQTTASSTAAVPTTGAPTTAAPTTGAPTTAAPTTAAPTTAAATTVAPTTAAPTTAASTP